VPGPDERQNAGGGGLRLSSQPLDLRLSRPWTIARGTSTFKTNVLVRLTEGGGTGDEAGLGEAAPNLRYGEDSRTVAAALGRLTPLLAHGLKDWSGLLDRLALLEPRHPAARAALDIAIHDLAAQRHGIPVHRLIGADPVRMPETSYSIGLDIVPVMQEKVRAAAGFPILKIKLDGKNDRAVVEGVREVTDRPLVVDVNEAWRDVADAIEMIRWLAGMGVLLVEQPLPAGDLIGAQRVRARSVLPIFADEAVLGPDDLPALRDAYDGVNVKVQKSGGLRPSLMLIAAARRLGFQVMIGCMIESSLGITAAAHLAPFADRADLDGHLLLAEDPFRGAEIEGGLISLPRGTGLGVTPR
jgi:L-alanine-DL-glutamate epimerase-like enolase superfamily enzyme